MPAQKNQIPAHKSRSYPDDRKNGFLRGWGDRQPAVPWYIAEALADAVSCSNHAVRCEGEILGMGTANMAKTVPISSLSSAGPSATRDSDGSSSAGAAPLLARPPDSTLHTHTL